MLKSAVATAAPPVRHAGAHGLRFICHGDPLPTPLFCVKQRVPLAGGKADVPGCPQGEPGFPVLQVDNPHRNW